MQGSGAHLRLMLQIEFLERLLILVQMAHVAFALVDALGDGENDEDYNRECQAVNGRNLLREQVRDGDKSEDERRHSEAHRDFNARQSQVEWELVFLVVALITEHQHAQRFQEKAPHHAERVRLAEQVHVSTAEYDRGNLENCDQIDDAISGSEALVRFAEPIEQDAVFGHAVEHAVCADDRSVHGARENQDTNDDHENVEQQLEELWTGQTHRQTAQQIIGVQSAYVVRTDDDAGEHGNHAGADDRVPAHDV